MAATWRRRSSPAAADRGSPAGGLDAVDRGLHDDLEQPDAVEALGERLADAADRLGQARPLALELLQPRRELLGHRVELLAERGELVVALGRDALGEVAAADRPRGHEQALDLGLQRARDGDRERDREQQEADQRADHDPGRAGWSPAVAGARDAHREVLPVEAADAQRRDAELLAVDRESIPSPAASRADSSGRDAPTHAAAAGAPRRRPRRCPRGASRSSWRCRPR